MTLPPNAAPGVERYVESAAESACHLADITGPGSWSAAAVDDVLDTIDALAGALSEQFGQEAAAALAPVKAATVEARRLLVPAKAPRAAAATGVPGPRTARRPRQHGLGPGFTGIRTAG
ncbi:hypothetical protein SAMN04487980_10405 [Streptomyces sp. cf124]|uniref:hypothetical protein n=1 Tax=Streptomyces sp. cf124 TaxID=1761903 RepID=UPI0008DFF425|nr:hypothetical protein [Streptomyces sp. cf124]SFN95343.1 hypothetical protein SAMN04487980_10405 [Streptomyces sp. cf124]